MRVFLAKEGATGRPSEHQLSDGATGRDLIQSAGIGENYVQFEVEGSVYKRQAFLDARLSNNTIVVATATKATNGN